MLALDARSCRYGLKWWLLSSWLLLAFGCGSEVLQQSAVSTFEAELYSSSPSQVYRSFTVIAYFESGVSDFTLADISVSGGQASALESITDKTYQFLVTPEVAGAIQVTLPAGAVTNASGETNDAAPPLSRTFTLLANAYQSGILAEPDLLAYWTLDDTWTDLVFGTTGLLSGGSAFTTAKIGTKSALFDGAGDYVSVASSTIPGGNRPISVEVWANIAGDNSASTYKMLTGIGTTSNDNTNLGLGFETGATNNIFISHWGSGDWYTGLPVSSGAWHHLVYTYNGTTEIIYVDGVEGARRDHTFIVGTNPRLTIGSWNDYVGSVDNYSFNGAIDEVAYYDGVLSAATIQAHFVSGQ